MLGAVPSEVDKALIDKFFHPTGFLLLGFVVRQEHDGKNIIVMGVRRFDSVLVFLVSPSC